METNLSNVYTVKGEYHLDYILCFFFFLLTTGSEDSPNPQIFLNM